MFYVQLAPLGDILGHLKSDFGVFWPFWAIISIYIKFAKCDIFLGSKEPILRLSYSEMAPKIQQLG